MPSYVWTREDLTYGLGFAQLTESTREIVVDATEIGVDGHRSWVVRFAVVLDTDWRTRDVTVSSTADGRERRHHLVSDGHGRWTIDKAPAPSLDACTDVDISATPCTNTFVIRRLQLAVGASAHVRAAWVGVPDLEVEPLTQTYTRLDPTDGVDRYEYADDRFGRWLLSVDSNGVVINYERFARRVAVVP